MAVLRYGCNSSVRIDLVNGQAAGQPDVPRGQPLADPAAATAAALAEPIDYPALAQSTTPGDRVVLAMDCGVPQAAPVVAAIIGTLIDAGVEADGISVLQSPAGAETAEENPCRLLSKTVQKRTTLLVHDPADRRQLAYLAADDAGEAILIHRALHEADLILPVGCLRGAGSAGYFGIHTALYPTFSDVKTLQRFRGLGSLGGGPRKKELTARVDHVGWLLGINLTVQVVPAAGEEALHVLAGRSDSVRRRGRELYHAAWDWPVRNRASLVIAAIDGRGEQTWENVGRALRVARRFAEDDGAIAVCCDLAVPPGPALQQLAGGETREAALRRLAKQRPVDALPAAQLAAALERNKIYFLSRLDPSVVEDLDMVPIENAEELVRLARQHRSCLLIPNAPRVTVVKNRG
jgi:nickel-dependent lactate racemase